MTTLTSPLILPHIADWRACKPGVYENIPEDIYHAGECEYSNSRGTDMMRSARYCHYRMYNPKDTTPALIFGDVLHKSVMQPELVDDYYIVAQPCSATLGKGGKCGATGKYLAGDGWRCGRHAPKLTEAFAKVEADLLADDWKLQATSDVSDSRYYEHPDHGKARVSDHAPNEATRLWMIRENVRDIRVDLPPYGNLDPRQIISADDMDRVHKAVECVMDNDMARRCVQGAESPEVSLMSHVDVRGEPLQLVRTRPDLWLRSKRIMSDVKTTDDASRESFEKSIFNFGYYRQAGLYTRMADLHGEPVDDFLIIAVEKSEPFDCAVYRITDEVIDAGWRQSVPLIEAFNICVESGEWPGLGDQITDIGVPAWAQRRLERVA